MDSYPQATKEIQCQPGLYEILFKGRQIDRDRQTD